MESVYIIIKTVMNNIERKAKELTQESPTSVLNLNQMYVLDSLYTKDGQHPSALSKCIGTPATSFTPVLDSLERLGLICRQPDLTDRRAVHAFLTDQGRLWCADIHPALQQLEKDFAKTQALA